MFICIIIMENIMGFFLNLIYNLVIVYWWMDKIYVISMNNKIVFSLIKKGKFIINYEGFMLYKINKVWKILYDFFFMLCK